LSEHHDPRADYETQTPITLTIQGEVNGGFAVALNAAVDGSDPAKIDATLDMMRRSFIRQDAFMRYTLALEDLRQAEFALSNIEQAIEAKRRQHALERAEMIAGFSEKWVSNNRLGEFKMNANERSNIVNFDDKCKAAIDELLRLRDEGLPLKIKNAEAVARDYYDLLHGKDKHEIIERRFVEDKLRPHDVPLPEAAE